LFILLGFWQKEIRVLWIYLKPGLFSDLNIKHFGLALIFTAGYGIIVFVLYRYFNYIY